MFGVRECFSELNERGVSVEVELGHDRVVRAVGRGKVSFQRESRPPLRFRDVYYVPGLRKNLISVFIIEDRGFEVLFREGHVYILPKWASFASTKVIGTRCGKLYRLDFHSISALMSSDSSESHWFELWQRRMAHLHHGALRLLREIVTGLPQFGTEHQKVCRGCALGKYTKTSFLSSEHRASGVLDLVHSDVCGAMSTISLSGHEYCVVYQRLFKEDLVLLPEGQG